MTNKGNDKHEDADSVLHKKLYPMFIRNFKILPAVVPEKSLTKNLLEKKKNGQIKEMRSTEDADSVLHNTTSHTQCLYKISNS